MKNNITLECKRVKFYSSYDEDAFFEWIKKIECVADFKGVGDKIFLFIKSKKINNEELFDLYALFLRFKIDKKQLDIFLDKDNEEVFHTYKNDFHINVYPKERSE